MSSRTRLLEILNAAGLAKLKDEQALREGQNDAANTAQWAGALQSLVPAATSALGAYQGSVAKEADTAAAQEIANHAADVGDNVDTPTTIASGAVAGNDKLAPKKPTGILDSLGALLGNRESAAAAAKAKATAGITGEVMANREKQRLIEKAKDDEAAKVARDEQTRMDAAQVRSDEREFRSSEAEAARAAKEKQDADKLGAGNDAEYFGLIRKKQAHLVPDEWWSEHFPGVAKPKAPVGGPAAPGSDADLRHRKLVADVAAAEATADTKANPKPPEGARKDMAELNSTMNLIDDVQKKKGEIDTGLVSKWGNQLGQWMGIDDPKKSAFRAEVSGLRDDMLHALSGAAISPSEMGRLMEGLPSFEDNDSAFVAKLTAMRARIKSRLDARAQMEGVTPSGNVSPRDRAAPAAANIPSDGW
jgi:hypothetical protein